MCACVCVCVRYDVLRCDKAYAQACTDEHVCVCECVLTPLREAVTSVHPNIKYKLLVNILARLRGSLSYFDFEGLSQLGVAS